MKRALSYSRLRMINCVHYSTKWVSGGIRIIIMKPCKPVLTRVQLIIRAWRLTQIHGCFNASDAVMRLYGLTVNIWLIKFFASGVTVSHSGDGYYVVKIRIDGWWIITKIRQCHTPNGYLKAGSRKCLPASRRQIVSKLTS